MKVLLADAVVTAGGRRGDAVLVDRGRIVAVGRRDDPRFASRTPVVHDGVVVPGLVDSHLHPVGYATTVGGLSVGPARGFDDLGELLGAAAAQRTPQSALVAVRLDEDGLAEGRLPTADDLDRWTGDVPTVVYRYCGHVAVANRAALHLAGVDARTADPPGGIIDRTSQGDPTGVLRETAIGLVASAVAPRVPPPGPDDLLAALGSLTALGLTRIVAIAAAGSNDLWCGPTDEVAALAAIADRLPLDVHLFVATTDRRRLERSARTVADAGGRLHFAGVKLFADGSFGGRTAALHRPYSDDPDNRGTLRLDPTRDRELVAAARDLGGTAAIHAIGDRAIDAVLDLAADPTAPPVRIEHVSLPTEEAIVRMADLGVVASVQPPFLASEATWLPGRLGGRMERVYPFATLRRYGIPTVAGSDSPVESPDPLAGIAAALWRDGFSSVERLSGPDALDLYTGEAHRVLGLGAPLQPGAPADLVVLDGDPTVADPSTLRVVAVYKAGEPVEATPLPWPG